MLARFRAYSPVLLVVATMSCYQYVEPPAPTVVQPSRDVRLTLNADGRLRLANVFGPQVREVFGRVKSADSTGLTVSVSRIALLDGTETNWTGEETRIDASNIRETEIKKVSTARTTILIVVVAGAAVAISLAIGHGSSTNGKSVGQQGAQ